jgi:uncharacterized protein (UPF0333 family)
MKKIYLTLGILLLATIAMAYLYFSNQNTDKNGNDLSLHAVAKNCAIVFSFDNDKSFYEILSGQDLIQNLLGETKSKQLKNLKDQLIEKRQIFNEIDGQKTFIGISAENNEVNFVIATQLKASLNLQNLISAIDQKAVKFKKIGSTFELTFADSTRVFGGFKERLVLLSNNASTITSLFAMQQEDATFVAYIKENSRFNKNNLANLFINFNKMPSLLTNILANNLTGELGIFNKQDTYAAFNYNFSKERLLFNGNTTLNSSENFYGLFVNLQAQQLTIANILPEKTANYTIYGINNYLTWKDELNKWLAINKEDEKINSSMKAINEKYRLDLLQILPKYFKNQFVTFQLNTGEKFGAVELNDEGKVNQFLLDLSSEYAPDIRIFKESNIPFAFFGQPFKKFDRPFYTIIDNYLIMANNASSIQSFLNSYSSNKLLINDQDYISFSNQLSSSSTILFYVNNKNSNDIFGRNLKMPYYKQYQSKNGFKKYNAFCYQLSGDKGKFVSNLLLFKKEEKINEIDTIKVNQ